MRIKYQIGNIILKHYTNIDQKHDSSKESMYS